MIAGATVQRLACDATVTRVHVDAKSAVVDVGHSERVVTSPPRAQAGDPDLG